MGYKGNYIYINLLLFVSLPVHMASLWWQCRLWAAEPGGGAPNEALWGAAQAGAALGWGSSSRLWLCDDARGSPGFGMAEYVLMPCYQPWKTLLEWELGGVLAIRGRTWCSYSFKGVWPKKKKGRNGWGSLSCRDPVWERWVRHLSLYRLFCCYFCRMINGLTMFFGANINEHNFGGCFSHNDFS